MTVGEARGAPRTALILAAGRGSRLGARGRLEPKGCLRLGERTIVEESIERLRGVGVQRVVIVTGHLREHYERLAAGGNGSIETVHNPEFAASGSLWSLRCARAAVTEDCLLLESDLVYERRALEVLCGSPQRDLVLLSGPTGSGDEVHVRADAHGALIEVSKDPARLGGPATGELVGISRVSRELLDELADEAERQAATTLHREYEQHGFVAVGARRPLRCVLVPDLAWCEIDDERQLARARELVHPLVLARDAAGQRAAAPTRAGGQRP